jgi:hypothetical protein
MISIPVDAVDTNSVTASTNATIKQGNSAYCYVNIDSTENLAALDITVHFDPAKVRITNVYNSISCTLYDSVTNSDNIRFSYILDGQGTTSQTRLFYFQYQVLNEADLGNSYFDITIGEAYDNTLNDVAVSGSRCNFTIVETVTNKTCSVYGSGSVSTAIEQKFTLSYRLSTYQIASGTVVINYDSELFEVVEVTNGNFLTGKVVDVNTDLTGEIYLSFVGTEYYSNTNLVSVTFRTIKNVAEKSQIELKTTELLDKELNAISCSGYKTSVNITFDQKHAGNAPSMRLGGTFSYEDKQITMEVSLEAGSNLGAGDFVINFDPKLVSYNSCTKGFSPSFFNVNDKNVEAGELKFHIISLSDIVTEEKVLTVVFDVNYPYACKTTDFTLNGSGLTDSMTEGILLNFVNEQVWLEYQVVFCDADGKVLQSDMYHYGDVIEEPDAPVKASDVYGSYTFNGWDKTVGNCTADAIYTATYDLKYHDYTVTFEDWDGTELSKAVYHYGETIAMPDEPRREGETNYTYVFVGWDKEISRLCTGDVVYTAKYEVHYWGLKLAWDGVTTDDRTVQVNVKVLGEAQISAGNFVIAYNDAQVVCVNAEVDSELSLAGGSLNIGEDIGNGEISFSYKNGNPANEDMAILCLTFKIADGFFGETILESGGENVVNNTYENIILEYKPHVMNLNSIAGLQMSDVLESYTYTGESIEPIVKLDGLSEGQDYQIVYSNNVNVGLATITIMGKGNYSGYIEKTFAIIIRNDLNMDGIITTDDAIYLMYHTMSPDRYPVYQEGDINKDGSVTSNDAIYLLYHMMLPEHYPILCEST